MAGAAPLGDEASSVGVQARTSVLQISPILGQKVIRNPHPAEQPVRFGHRLIECQAPGAVSCKLINKVALDFSLGGLREHRAGLEVDQAKPEPAQALVVQALDDAETILPPRVMKGRDTGLTYWLPYAS